MIRRIESFVSQWAKSLGAPFSRNHWNDLETELKKYPSYFVEDLSRRATLNPLLTKASLVKFRLFSSTSPFTEDREVASELSKEALQNLPDVSLTYDDYEKLKRRIFDNFNWAAMVYFSEKYQPLSNNEKWEWRRKIDHTPLIFLPVLTQSPPHPALLLLFLDQLGISTLGFPARTELPLP